MDTSSVLYLVLDIAPHSFLLSAKCEEPHGKFGNPKRYAVYFSPYDKSGQEQVTFPGPDSTNVKNTWEIIPKVSIDSHDSASSRSCSSDTTPAQEIANLYRAGASLDSSETRSSCPSVYTDDDVWELASLDDEGSALYVPAFQETDIHPVYRQSRFEALLDTRAQATKVMESSGLGEDDVLECPRPGCHDKVRNVKALMYHLHVHDIHEQCLPEITQKDEDQNYCTQVMNRYNGRFKPFPTGPFKDYFRRVFTKFPKPRSLKSTE